MSATRRHHQRAAAGWLFAILGLAVIAGTAINRRAMRLREAYEAHQLLEDQGLLHNEVRWRQADYQRLARTTRVLDLAGAKGLAVERTRKNVEFAPQPRTEGPGQ
ncbi:MAG: hypothetical protein CMJ83_14715 [Planctomycetes bacterium]|nr:hypothetical protein [Planctomycetota bacterium]